jgi:putative RNA 2'-phosphotransferase
VIAELIARARENGRVFSESLIHDVVATSDKKRFALSEDGLRIRAVQGHSSESVDIAYEAKVPPEILFHGTATRFLDSIREQGLRPGSRHHVHLSEKVETATAVGSRYGKPVVLRIDAGRMHRAGFQFFQADNGVWLTERVPPEFLEE